MDNRYFRVRSLHNGGIYMLTKKKLDAEIGSWEMAPEEVVENKVVKQVFAEPEEIMLNDVEEEGVLSPSDLSYVELKSLAKKMNITYKGNLGKEALIALIEG